MNQSVSPAAAAWLLPLLRRLLLRLLLLLPLTADAVYRCEHHGQITYTDLRCAGRQIDAAPPPSPHSSAHSSTPSSASTQASDPSARERAEVAKLQALREQRERQDRQIRDLAARGAAARERKCSSLALQRKWREEDLREAPLDKAPKARTRLRRSAEKYEAECR